MRIGKHIFLLFVAQSMIFDKKMVIYVILNIVIKKLLPQK
jgi:hypothetical protein